MFGLQKMVIENYRSLQHVEISPQRINILFGPNGSGKSTFLDALWFVRDCSINGVDAAASDRSHGIGVLSDQAEPGAHISIEIETSQAIYSLSFGFSSGRIEPYAGEKLVKKSNGQALIDRMIGGDRAQFFDSKQGLISTVHLREPQKLSLERYLDVSGSESEAGEISCLLHFIRKYDARSANFYRLRNIGSASGPPQQRLYDRCENLWSILRNLKEQRELENKSYDTIMQFMNKGFPTFGRIYLESQGAANVYGSFIEKDHKDPIRASGISDGHLQLLIHLTALFCESENPTLILLDEPETSLHPHAIVTLAEAITEAVSHWNKQVFVATHSPILISQFNEGDIIASEIGPYGETMMRRVSEIEKIQDLLDHYAVGSLYMAELIAPQSKLEASSNDE